MRPRTSRAAGRTDARSRQTRGHDDAPTCRRAPARRRRRRPRGRGRTRFRGPGHKLDAQLDGRTIVDRAVGTALAAGIGPVVVVTARQIATALHPTVVHVVNERWADGQITSLRAGIDAARELGATAVVVGLGDQPFVTVERGATSPRTDAPIAVATYDGRRGHPVRLHRDTWDLLPVARRRRRPHADASTTRSRH